MKRKLLAAALTLCMLFSLLPAGTFTAFATDADLTIETAAELVAFRDAVNGGQNYSGQTIQLGADIDLSSYCGADINSAEVSWTPIGNSGNTFAGTFDGGGYTISGLYINTATNGAHEGLFGVSSGTIQNLNVSGSITVTASNCYVGGIAGYNSGTIDGCTSGVGITDPTTAMGNMIGGIAGLNAAASRIENCKNNGTLTGNGIYVYIGGITGYNKGDLDKCVNTDEASITGSSEGGMFGGIAGSNDNAITYSENNADVKGSGNGACTGGITGWSYYDYDDSNWQYKAEITNCVNTGSVSGNCSLEDENEDDNFVPTIHVGGIAGLNRYDITDCTNTGSVTGHGYVARIGGVAGETYGGTVSGCYNRGEVSCSNEDSADDVGGIVGYNSGFYNSIDDYFDGVVENCYNFAEIKGGMSVGGVVGYNNDMVRSSLNYGSVASILSGNGSSIGGIVGYNCYDVSLCANFADLDSKGTVGGIVGTNEYGYIETSFNACNTVKGAITGGIAGSNYEAEIEDCYNTAKISGSSYAGGLVGDEYESFIINSSYSFGEVADANADRMGGVAGGIDGGTISNCYYNTDAYSGNNGYGAGLAASAFAETANFSGWDFTDTWTMSSVLGRPILQANEEPLFSGEGTEENPYEIPDLETLLLFTKSVNGGTNYDQKYVKLTNDIDLSGDCGADIGGNEVSWTPIGDSETNVFAGTFDGGGFTISGLYINNSTDSASVGLFGVNSGTIQNLNVSGAITVNASNCNAGGIAGFNNNGTVSGCTSGVSITDSTTAKANAIGGIAGGNNTSGGIDNCTNTGILSGGEDSSVGGIAGSSSNRNIQNCQNSASVTGKNAGGIVGNQDSGSVTACFNTGEIQGVGASAAAVGGIAGTSRGTIQNCYNTADISGNDATDSCAGGVVGSCDNGTVLHCYSVGGVSGAINIGGVIGRTNGAVTVTNCFYNKEAYETADATVGVTGLSTQEFADESNFTSAGWNFTEIWSAGKDIGRPVLTANVETWITGTGEEIDPYLIPDLKTLLAFAASVNAGVNSVNRYEGKYVKLTADIDINPGITFNEDGTYEGGTPQEWTPIGNESLKRFEGIFDGDGHTISGLYINNSEDTHLGLFGAVGGTIKNLTVSGSITAGGSNQIAGGITGTSRGGAVIDGCTSNVYITDTESGQSNYIGGIVGYNRASSSVVNSVNSGMLKGIGSSAYIGGIAGYNCGNVTGCSNSAEITSVNEAGGIVGQQKQDDADVPAITVCFNTGTVRSTGSSGTAVGGVIGHSGGIIQNCYNQADVVIDAEGNSHVAGGIVGYGESTSSLKNCYSVGSVTGPDDAWRGGIVGNTVGTTENCYYETDTATETINGVTGKIAAQFASGEVAYLLQSGQETQDTQIWGQNIKSAPKESYPVFSSENEKKVLKVTFKANNSDYAAAYTNSGGTVTLPVDPASQTYSFRRWSQTNSVTGEEFTASTVVTGDMTVYAVGQEMYGEAEGQKTITTTYGRAATKDLSDYMIYAGDTTAAGKFTYIITGGNFNKDNATASDNYISATIVGDTLTIPNTTSADIYTLEITATEKDPVISLFSADSVGTSSVELILTVVVNKVDAAVSAAPQAVSGLVYNGSPQELVTAGKASGGTMVYSLSQTGLYSENIPTGTAAGDYTVWYKVSGDSNHNDTAPQSITVRISREDSETEVSGNEVTYGETLKLEATVKRKTAGTASTTLLATEDTVDFYSSENGKTWLGSATVLYDGPDKDSGTATLYLNTAEKKLGIGDNEIRAEYGGSVNLNSSGSNSITVKLLPKTVEYTVSAESRKYNGSAAIDVTLTLVRTGIIYGDEVCLSAEGTLASANAGTYAAVDLRNIALEGAQKEYYTVSAESASDVSLERVISISQADASIALSAGNPQGEGENRSVDLTAVVTGVNGEKPDGSVTFYNGEALLDTVALKDGTAVLTWTQVPTGSHTIKAVYGGNQNYAGAENTTTYNADSDEQAELVIGEVTGRTYGDGPFTLKVTGGSGTGALSYSVKSGSSVSVDETTGLVTILAAGESTIEVIKAADDNYNEAKAEVTIRIAQAVPSITEDGAPTAARVEAGQTLSASSLSGGRVTGIDGTELKGAWSWKDGEKEMSGTGTFEETAVFTPEDTNYAAIETPVSVTVYSSSSSGGSGGSGGGGGSVTSYTVTFDTRGGSSIDSVKVNRNGTVARPDEPTREGYVFEGWFTDADCTEAYDFDTKVTKNITLYAKWTEKTTEPVDPEDPAGDGEWENPFADVAEGDWFYDYVRYAYENGLFTGISGTEFDPNGGITRAMIVTVLYRAEGEPDIGNEGRSDSFDDVVLQSWYGPAVYWAQMNGVVKGYSDEVFAPDKLITREEMTAIMYRYADYKGVDTSAAGDLSQFSDQAQIANWARGNVEWSVGYGLISGRSDGTLDPKGNITRAETAAILQRFLER